MNKLIAITGQPGSGKTTLAIQLALSMSRSRRVMLVLGDFSLPPKDYLFAEDESESIGKLFSAIELSDRMVWKAVTPVDDNLGVLGYRTKDTVLSHPMPTASGVELFLTQLSGMAEVIVLDLPDEENALTQVARKQADKRVVSLSATPKGMSWAGRNAAFDADVTVLNNVYKGQACELDDVEKLYILPHCTELRKASEGMKAFLPCGSRSYCKELERIQKELRI